MNKDERNAQRRAAYAAKKQERIDAQAGKNALRNLDKLDLRVDGFYSTVTGAGISGIDKFTSYKFSENDALSSAELESLYLDSDVAATIVDRAPKDALRGGYALTWDDATDGERDDVVQWAESKLNVTGTVLKARIYSRLFGGGAALIGSDNGGPAPFKAPRADGLPVDFLRPVPSSQLRAKAWDADVGSQGFSTVVTYDYHLPSFNGIGDTGKPSVGTVEVDASHTLPFYGLLTTDDRFRELDGWGDSVLRRVYEPLKQFEAAYQSILHTLSENSIPVYKVEGLLKMLASENADLLQARFQLLNAGKSSYRAIVLGENEEFLRVNAPLQEAANVVQSAMQRVAGAAGQPMTIIWGMSPAGMNATGQSDLEIWNQQVAKEQTLEIGPALLSLYRTILADPSSPLGGNVPEDLAVEFPSLWTPSLQDQVNNYAQVAGADVGYVNANVLKPEQVALSRAKQRNTLFPSIDTYALESALALDADPSVIAEEPLEAPESPDVGSPGGLDTPAGSEPQKAALNGAQISGLQALAVSVADGSLPLETAKAIASAAFPLTSAALDAIFSPLPAGKFEEKQNAPDPVLPANPLAGLGEPSDPEEDPEEEDPAANGAFGE